MKKLILTFLMGSLLISCATHTVDEKESLRLSKMMANMQSDLSVVKTDLSSTNGLIEESENRTNNKINGMQERNMGSFAVLNERINIVEASLKVHKILIEKIAENISLNSDLLIKINQEYKDFRKEAIDVKTHQRLKKAERLYLSRDYDDSFQIYKEYLDKPHLLKSREYMIVLYRVGTLEYKMEKYDDSLVHLSQLYQKFYQKNDKYMASSLYHIGNILIKRKDYESAQKMLNQIVLEHKNHKYFYRLAQERLSILKKHGKIK